MEGPGWVASGSERHDHETRTGACPDCPDGLVGLPALHGPVSPLLHVQTIGSLLLNLEICLDERPVPAEKMAVARQTSTVAKPLNLAYVLFV